VCQDCVRAHPPCTCSYCEGNYLCPNCYRIKERDGTCRRIEEERVKREEKQKRDLEMFEVALERNLANEVAGFAGQFFGRLVNEGEGLPDHELRSEDAGAGLEAQVDSQGPGQGQMQGQGVQGDGEGQVEVQANDTTVGYDDDENDPAGSASDHTELLGEEI